MAKALLILFGGRIIPNVLTILHLKPQIIVPIVSNDVHELNRLDTFKKGVDDLLKKEGHSCEWLDRKKAQPFAINAFDKEDIKMVCEKVVKDNKDKDDKYYEWTFNITSGTSIMSIGAYEAAKELIAQGISISCWYLNTAKKRVEALVGEARDSLLDDVLFSISIQEYATAHNKVLRINLREDTLPSEEKRLEFALFLVASPAYIRALRKLLVEKDKADLSVESVHFQISRQNKEQENYTCERPLDSDEKAVLMKAENYGLIQNLTTTKKTSLSFKISGPQFLFLNGGWLELYVQSEVANIKENGQPLFQDIGSNRLVHNKTEQGYNKEEENEIDVSMIYNAQLFIVECKAGSEVKKSETIFKLDSVANAFGGGFVGKYLVTALSKNEIEKLGNNSQTEKSNFQERLEIRKIVLITLDELKDLKTLFRNEAKNPKYPRI